MQHIHSNFPNMFDYSDDLVVHVSLLNAFSLDDC